jgi:ribosomal-protein-alanine N-acetyltransferase
MYGITIRPASPKDLLTVYEIETQSFTDPYRLPLLHSLYQANRRTFLVAEKDGAVVGYVIVSVRNDFGHIISIAVRPAERKKNIGSAIVNEVLLILKDMDVRLVRLEVRRNNAEAQSFYERLGFTQSHALEKYYGDEDALVYFRLL